MKRGTYPVLGCGGKRMKTASLRILDNVIVRPQSRCWMWTSTGKRYGVVAPRGGHGYQLAHRFSFETFRGQIPKGLYVLHRCDRPRCVNPNHLWLGTQADNLRDMVAKGRHRNGTPRPH